MELGEDGGCERRDGGSPHISTEIDESESPDLPVSQELDPVDTFEVNSLIATVVLQSSKQETPFFVGEKRRFLRKAGDDEPRGNTENKGEKAF